MKRQKTRRASTVRTALRLESLESRWVMDGAVGPSATLERFDSVAELENHLLDEAVAPWKELFGTQFESGWWSVYSADRVSVSGGNGSSTLELAVATPAAPSGWETNVQVTGVDEGDFVKSDGRYLYVARDRLLTIVDTADPADLRIASRLELKQPAAELYVAGDRLVVVSQVQSVAPMVRPAMMVPAIWPPVWDGAIPQPEVTASIWNIEDRTAPREVTSLTLDGSLVASRVVGDQLILVSQDDLSLSSPQYTCESQEPADSARLFYPSVELLMADGRPLPGRGWSQICTYETEAAYRERYAGGWLEAQLPRVTWGGDEATAELLVDPDEIADVSGPGNQLVTTTVVDFGGEQPVLGDSAGVVLPYVGPVYATAGHVYVATTIWDQEAGEHTTLVQFTVDSTSGEVDATAAGTVPGRLINSFALDEHAGFLRAATTHGWGESAQSGLYVLESAGEQLAIKGSVTGITPGETMFSARFLGDRAFLVTFERIDPLVAVDLADPTAPRVAGELEITGFSNYLHPVAGDYLLGLGQDADPANGRWLHPQVSLFQVSDLAAPRLLDRQAVGRGISTWSPAMYDHHALQFWSDAGVLAVPFQGVEGDALRMAREILTQPDRLRELLGIPAVQTAVEHLSARLSADAVRSLAIQYLPTSLVDLVPDSAADHESILTFMEDLPERMHLRQAANEVRELLETLTEGEVGPDGLRTLIAGLSPATLDVLRRVRERLPGELQEFVRTLLGEQVADPTTLRSQSGLWLFRVDPAAEDPLTVLGIAAAGEQVDRSFLHGSTLITITADEIRTHLLTEPTKSLDELRIGPRLQGDWVVVETKGEAQQIEVLSNDDLPDGVVIAAVSETSAGGTLRIAEDGRSIWYTPAGDSLATENGRVAQPAHDELFLILPAFQDHFTYTVEIPGLGRESADVWVNLVERVEPESQLVSDYFRVRQDAAETRLDVMANDFANMTFIRAPQITAVSEPDQGGRVTIEEGGTAVLYTPASGFHGRETFTYAVDAGLTGQVTIEVVPSADENEPGDPLVSIRVALTDANGVELTQMEVGDSGLIQVYVDDLREAGEGVFGAYLDLVLSGSGLTVTGEIEHATDYLNGVQGTVGSTGVEEMGGFAVSFTPLGGDERLLVTIPVQATAAGPVSITANPADDRPAHDVTLFGANSAISPRRIHYGATRVVVVNTLQPEVEATDANGDGVTSPTDALPLINWINEHGAGSIERIRAWEASNLSASSGLRRSERFDINRDGFCTHMDVLMVFNRVNEESARRAAAASSPGGSSRSAAPVANSVDAITPLAAGEGSQTGDAAVPVKALSGNAQSVILYGPFLPGTDSVVRRRDQAGEGESGQDDLGFDDFAEEWECLYEDISRHWSSAD